MVIRGMKIRRRQEIVNTANIIKEIPRGMKKEQHLFCKNGIMAAELYKILGQEKK